MGEARHGKDPRPRERKVDEEGNEVPTWFAVNAGVGQPPRCDQVRPLSDSNVVVNKVRKIGAARSDQEWPPGGCRRKRAEQAKAS